MIQDIYPHVLRNEFEDKTHPSELAYAGTAGWHL